MTKVKPQPADKDNSETAAIEPEEPMLEGWKMTDEQRKFIESMLETPASKPAMNKTHQRSDAGRKAQPAN